MISQTRARLLGILAGFCGGLAPFLVNLGQALVGRPALPVSSRTNYIFGLLIFGPLGAAMAFVFRELNLSKAFFLGVSAPAMISLAVKNPPKSTAFLDRGPGYYSSFALISSAYAQ